MVLTCVCMSLCVLLIVKNFDELELQYSTYCNLLPDNVRIDETALGIQTDSQHKFADGKPLISLQSDLEATHNGHTVTVLKVCHPSTQVLYKFHYRGI